MVNRPKTAAYRAPGANTAFARGGGGRRARGKLGITSDRVPAGRCPRGTRRRPARATSASACSRCSTRSSPRPHWCSPLGTPSDASVKRRGVGLATGFWFNAGLQSSATIAINQDGTASLVTGSPDIGGTRTSCAMIAAEELGIAVERVRPSVADTDSVGPPTSPAAAASRWRPASRSTRPRRTSSASFASAPPRSGRSPSSR